MATTKKKSTGGKKKVKPKVKSLKGKKPSGNGRAKISGRR